MVKIVDPDQLNQAVEVIIDTSALTVELAIAGNLDDNSPGASSGVTKQAFYSFLKEEWLADPALRKFDFPLKSFTKFEFLWINGWAPANLQTRELFRDAGWEESVGTEAGDKWAGFITLGSFDDTLDQGTYTQDPANTATVNNFDKTGNVNEAVLIYDASGPTDYTTFFKASLRIPGKTYDEYDLLAEQDLAALEPTVYRLPLSNATDLNISETDANIGANAPYTTIEVADYLTGQHDSVTTWAATTAYSVGDIVLLAGTGRYLRCTVAGTSGASEPAGAGTDGSVTWEVDPGERQIGSTYYHFSRIIDVNDLTNTADRYQVYEKAQYQLRQTGDINTNTNGDAFGAVNGNIAESFGEFRGEDYVGAVGVWWDEFNPNDTNNLVFVPHPVDGASPTEVKFPFVAAGNINFSDNLVNALDADTYYVMYFTNDDAGDNLGNDFNTTGAVIVQDDTSTDIAGQITSATISFTYDFDGNTQRGAASAGTTAPVTIHVISTTGGEIGSFEFNITQSTGLTFNCSVADERNYSNPA